MQYDAATPDDYLHQLETDWRKDTLLSIRQLILDIDPNLQEKINYKMLAYGEDYKIFCHLNAQKNYVSLYVGDSKKIDATGELLQGLNVGKGCIRFSKTKNTENTHIKQFVEKANQLWRAGIDIEC